MLRFLLPKDKSAQGPAQRDSSLKISAEDGLDFLVGNSACSFSATMLGKLRFRGECFRGVFQRGVSDPRVALRNGSVLCTQEAILLIFLLAKDKSAKGPAQRDSSSRISTEDGLHVPVGNSACSFSTTMLGQPRFRGVFQRGVSKGVFQRGVSEGYFRPPGVRDRPA